MHVRAYTHTHVRACTRLIKGNPPVLKERACLVYCLSLVFTKISNPLYTTTTTKTTAKPKPPPPRSGTVCPLSCEHRGTGQVVYRHFLEYVALLLLRSLAHTTVSPLYSSSSRNRKPFFTIFTHFTLGFSQGLKMPS